MLLPRLSFGSLGKSMGVKHKVLPDGQPPTVALTVIAQLLGLKIKEIEMGGTLFSKNDVGRTLKRRKNIIVFPF